MMVYFLPVISAAIGWFTNYVAIKMLFHPRQEKDFILFKLQGIFPKRKPMLAQRLGKIVARDLFTPEMITDKLNSEESKEQIKVAIIEKVDVYLNEKLKTFEPMLALFGGSDQVSGQLKGQIEGMIEEMIPQMTDGISKKVENIDIEKMVTEKVLTFSDEKFEDLLMSVIKKELMFIEVMGAVLGFMIGLLQVGLVMMS